MEPETWEDVEPWIELPTTIKPASKENLATNKGTACNPTEINTDLWNDGDPLLEIESTIKPSNDKPLNRVNLKENPIYEDKLEDEFCDALKVRLLFFEPISKLIE
jgi:hypothetical protein